MSWKDIPDQDGWYLIKKSYQSEQSSKFALVKDLMAYFPNVEVPWIPVRYFKDEDILWKGPLPEFQQVKVG